MVHCFEILLSLVHVLWYQFWLKEMSSGAMISISTTSGKSTPRPLVIQDVNWTGQPSIENRFKWGTNSSNISPGDLRTPCPFQLKIKPTDWDKHFELTKLWRDNERISMMVVKGWCMCLHLCNSNAEHVHKYTFWVKHASAPATIQHRCLRRRGSPSQRRRPSQLPSLRPAWTIKSVWS